MSLSCTELDVSIGSLLLISGLDLQTQDGEMICVLGCNGAGKTTLLHTLAGLHGSNNVFLGSEAVNLLPRREIARRLALLLQKHDDAFPLSVYDAVLSGRYPHASLLDNENEQDRAICLAALKDFGLESLAQRDVATLSGGERQRVALAAIVAQQTPILLLDEPLNNLDPRHQLDVMQRLRLECDKGAAVIAVLHDLNLAARFADRVLLLSGPGGNGGWRIGPTRQMMTDDILSLLYETPIVSVESGGHRFFAAG